MKHVGRGSCSSVIDSGEKHIPLLMSLGGNHPASGKRLLQHFKLGDILHSKLAPVRQRAAAAVASDLVSKEVYYPFLQAVILRLGDPNLILVGKAQQTPFINRRQQEIMRGCVQTRRRREGFHMILHSNILHELRRWNAPGRCLPEFVNRLGRSGIYGRLADEKRSLPFAPSCVTLHSR